MRESPSQRWWPRNDFVMLAEHTPMNESHSLNSFESSLQQYPRRPRERVPPPRMTPPRRFASADFLAWCLWVQDGCPAEALGRYRDEVALQLRYSDLGEIARRGENARHRTRTGATSSSWRTAPPLPS